MRLLLFNLATDADDPILGFTTRWIAALAKRMERIHVITMRAGRVEVPDNVQVHSVGKEKGHSEPRRAVEFYRHLFEVLRHDRIDACFSHMIPIFTVLAAPVLKAKGIPIVTWYAHRQVTTVLKLAHWLSNRMISANESSYRYRHDKFVATGHGIDTDLFSPDVLQPKNTSLLLSVGRLSPIKDPLTLIEAVHILRQGGYEVGCALIGEAPERDRDYAEQVQRRVRKLGLEGVVQFLGAFLNTEVVQWYHRCFAHVNCSPPDHALDKAALEAMACGRISLCSSQSFRETMGPWAEFLLFRSGDAHDLARKLVRLLELDPAEREAIGTQLRQRILKLHSLEGLTERLYN